MTARTPALLLKFCANSVIVSLEGFRHRLKGKLECTLVPALRIYTGRTAHRGSRGIALLFLDHGTRRG